MCDIKAGCSWSDKASYSILSVRHTLSAKKIWFAIQKTLILYKDDLFLRLSPEQMTF